ncbi:MAG: rhomboid family intramembrane serine protease [Candidatus Aenigmarchaeota archaeon]|nr:rhomboid family intramembrane serine protease [Candidatus Aenigmarchaeota archaeon]
MVRNKATIILAVLCIIITIFAWTSNTKQIFNNYGYSTENLLSGKYYVPITSIFLHSDLNHLLLNLLVLLVFGLALEEEIGPKKFLILFFSGAFLGDLLSSLIYSSTQISIGASAGIFSIMAAAILIKPIKIEVFVPIPLGLIGIGYLISAIIGLIANYPPYVAHIAHMGGIFAGLFYGFKVRGSWSALKILIVFFLLFLLFPFIWNFWVLITKVILGIFS